MKTLRLVSALLFAAVLAGSVTAQADSHLMAPQTAVETNAMVHSVQTSLTSQGYVLESVDEEAQPYIVKPSAPFFWGHLVYIYSRPGHSLALPREKVEMVAKLQYLTTGIAVPELSVRHLLAM